MYRIAPQNLAWAMENLLDGNLVNEIVVEDETKAFRRHRSRPNDRDDRGENLVHEFNRMDRINRIAQ